MEKDLFPIGKVVKPHGVRGKIKIVYFGEDFNHFPHYRHIVIKDDKGRPQTYEIVEAIPQPPRFILQLKGIERIEETEPLMGKEILLNRDVLPNLQKGEYYWFEIVGLEVETETGKRIGRVKEIFSTGAHDVYVIEGKRREIFLPATEEVIQQIDLQKKVMKVTRMEGLWEEDDEV
jgi:16S rRNA processing protein RimM